jgi:DNA-binding CsgD family transcriptional regulator
MIIFAVLDRGDVPAARTQVDRLQAAAGERGIDMRALVAGLQALVTLGDGDPDAALEGLRQATELAGPDVQVLDRAELHHRMGRLLTARGRRREGVSELRQAAALLEGAEPFVRRVEADLAQAGMHTPRQASGRRGARSPLELTDRERDVVALVRRGLTNREVAAELYVSEKAVEYHLGNVYAKLGIRSRRELRPSLGDRN